MTQHDIVDRYIAAWNATGAERGRLIDATFTEDASYMDPLMEGRAHDGLDALIEGVQTRFPGFRFARAGGTDQHHDRIRFSWTLGPEGAEAPIAGTDVATIAADGRLATVVGFLDRVPLG